MRKAQLLARMMIARDEWELLVNHVGSIRVGIGGVSGHWSVKNIVAHVMTREQHLADRLAEYARGEPCRPCQNWECFDAFIEEYGFPDFDSPLISQDAANELVYEKYKNAAMNELVADELNAFAALLAGVRALSEEQLNQYDLGPRIKHVSIDHYRQHLADIRKRFKRSVLRQS
ncbi:MAG: hypothetical protein ACOY0R_02650 [Chloroflexota bacterium]